MRGTRLLQLTSASLAIAIASVACGGAVAPTGTAQGLDTPSPGLGTPAVPAGRTGGTESATEVRLVNLWAEPTSLGPGVAIRLVGEDDLTPLVEAAPGSVSDYVVVPLALFGRGPARIELARAGAGADEETLELRNLESGDRLTVFAHGWPDLEGNVGLAAFYPPTDSWPTVPADKVTLVVYPGALQPLADAENFFALATVDGECLVDDTGAEQESGWGGNIARYLVLEPGITEIAISHSPGQDCQPNDPIGTVTVDGRGGDRFALIPWGQSGAIEPLLLEMSAPD